MWLTTSGLDLYIYFKFRIQADFTVVPGANPKSRSLKLARFPENPQANWGPKARAITRKRYISKNLATS